MSTRKSRARKVLFWAVVWIIQAALVTAFPRAPYTIAHTLVSASRATVSAGRYAFEAGSALADGHMGNPVKR